MDFHSRRCPVRRGASAVERRAGGDPCSLTSVWILSSLHKHQAINDKGLQPTCLVVVRPFGGGRQHLRSRFRDRRGRHDMLDQHDTGGLVCRVPRRTRGTERERLDACRGRSLPPQDDEARHDARRAAALAPTRLRFRGRAHVGSTQAATIYQDLIDAIDVSTRRLAPGAHLQVGLCVPTYSMGAGSCWCAPAMRARLPARRVEHECPGLQQDHVVRGRRGGCAQPTAGAGHLAALARQRRLLRQH